MDPLVRAFERYMRPGKSERTIDTASRRWSNSRRSCAITVGHSEMPPPPVPALSLWS